MERADLLYSGLMFTAGMLSLWTVVLLTAAYLVLAPSFRKSAPTAATISSTGGRAYKYRVPARPVLSDHVLSDHVLTNHGAATTTTPRSLSQALPQRSRLGRILRLI